MARIIKVAASGLPLRFAAQAGDITEETLLQWRKEDPKFARNLEQARLAAVERRWERIEKAAKGSVEHPPDWKADAWSLERVYPQLFGRPDLQLSVNQSVATGPTNVVVVGPERAKILATRYEQIRAKTRELLEAREVGSGNAQGSAQSAPALGPEPVSVQASAAPTDGASAGEPLPTKPSAWWRPFIFGGALIPKADASEALRLILTELRISLDERTLDFGTDNVVKSTFCKVLEQLSGSDLGWRTMVQIYERQQARERLWADH
jgi:hypothetical protein